LFPEEIGGRIGQMKSFILAVILVISQGTSDKNTHPNSQQNKTQAHQPPTSSVTVTNSVAPDYSKNLSQNKNNGDRKEKVSITAIPKVSIQKDRWDYLYIIGALLGVGVTLGIAVIALIQARTAALNAQAVIDSERAWILIDRGELADRIQDPDIISASEIATKGRMSHCIFFIKNFGKTPGKMTLCWSELQIGPDRSNPPRPQIYEATNGSLTVMLAPGESRAIEARGFGDFSDENIAGLARNIDPRFLWLCGIIRYEDIFERPRNKHKTTFCFLYERFTNAPKPFWRWAGPPELNLAT
jgi:hypothetical protein